MEKIDQEFRLILEKMVTFMLVKKPDNPVSLLSFLICGGRSLT
jgi:hypothetical protein